MYCGDGLSYCHLRSCMSPGFGHTDAVLSKIHSQTTVAHYHHLTTIFNTYKPQAADISGWNALCTAALNGNVEIAAHIINAHQKDMRLVDLATTFGWTPLFCAAVSSNHAGALAVSQLLLKEQANVNIATPYETDFKICDVARGFLIRNQRVPARATPVWGSLFISGNIALAVYLESQGGKYIPIPPIGTTALA